MAAELHIFMQDSRVPSRDTWQRQIDDLDFPTVLDPTLDIRRDKGFSPTSFKGESTGFEFYLEPATDILFAYTRMAAKIGIRDMCGTFRWDGDVAECGAALSAGAALAKVSDGIYFYPDDDIVCSADEAVKAARRDFSSM
jgi:hypothetical protein